MASKFDWSLLEPSTVAGEALHLSLALATLALGWISFPLLLVAVAVEVQLTVMLSALFFPERGARRQIVGALKMLGLTAFISIFLMAAYAGAGGFAQSQLFDALGFAAMVVLVALRVLLTAIVALRGEDRRHAWTHAALLRSGVLVATLFLAAFACFILGLPLALLLAMRWPEVAADVGVGGAFLLVQAGCACIISTMSDREIAAIADQPYLDDRPPS